MRWITFFILLYLCAAPQWARFGALSPYPASSPMLEYLPFLATFYALFSTDDEAPFTGLICGFLYDLNCNTFGVFTIALGLTSWLVVKIRLSIFREHLISQCLIGFLAVLFFHLTAGLSQLLIPWLAGHGLGGGSNGHSPFPFWLYLGNGLINAIYTAIITPLWVWILLHFTPILGFNLKGQHHAR